MRVEHRDALVRVVEQVAEPGVHVHGRGQPGVGGADDVGARTRASRCRPPSVNGSRMAEMPVIFRRGRSIAIGSMVVEPMRDTLSKPSLHVLADEIQYRSLRSPRQGVELLLIESAVAVGVEFLKAGPELLGNDQPVLGKLHVGGETLTEQPAGQRADAVESTAVHNILDVAEVHLVVGLLAPPHRLLRVRVGRVLVAVVVPRGVDQRAARGARVTGSAKRYCNCQLKS